MKEEEIGSNTVHKCSATPCMSPRAVLKGLGQAGDCTQFALAVRLNLV